MNPPAIIYESELRFVEECIKASPDIETGGQLFGYWTTAGDPVVLYAIGPGPNANHQVTFFQQDVPYLLATGRELVEKYGLRHIGEWHSHHHLGLPHPSGHDAETIASTLREKKIARFLLCIGSFEAAGAIAFNPFGFVFSEDNEYCPLAWDVKSGMSPFRMRIESDIKGKEMVTP